MTEFTECRVAYVYSGSVGFLELRFPTPVSWPLSSVGWRGISELVRREHRDHPEVLVLAVTPIATPDRAPRDHCPAVPGEDCPLTVDQCRRLIRKFADLVASGDPGTAERGSFMAVCCSVFDVTRDQVKEALDGG